MKRKTAYVFSVSSIALCLNLAAVELDRSVMSQAYWDVWNDGLQGRIDADIERYRQTDATFEVAAPDGAEVKVEQIDHAFFFGAHTFNFNQLGKKEWNDRSEITITAPDNSTTGQMVQAIILRNLYRLWFSMEKIEGITWWNVVDNCGAPGEPSISGIFTRDMQPKTAYFAMDDLINGEWKTRLTVKAHEGNVSFRGFRGRYRLKWIDADGNNQSKTVELK